ncbi:hypothetical protein FIBSPDRAFT_869959 [Athelia psychrophila]|uniref:Uncharacterized protein n=1 Tax=Athelia psychrophila TaxID=1759441 RepID=A0A166BJ35_9AGAM|nr:hypothetical protein FIBSPDRAFT_869959 [Fibularhizoctonia sp. CBS 109695]
MDCAPPLAEHLCLRGIEWVGHRVFERGYWKNGEEKSKEIEVLDTSEDSEVTDGIIEDEDDRDDSSLLHRGSGTEIVKSSIHTIQSCTLQKVLRWKKEDRIDGRKAPYSIAWNGSADWDLRRTNGTQYQRLYLVSAEYARFLTQHTNKYNSRIHYDIVVEGKGGGWC